MQQLILFSVQQMLESHFCGALDLLGDIEMNFTDTVNQM
jgi:hypothetical protein